MKLAYLGIEGSFSHQAACEAFGNHHEGVMVDRFVDVCQAVKEGSARYGVLPIENSTTGVIGSAIDLIQKKDLMIVGEKTLPIHHHLIGLKGRHVEEAREVHSHPQAFDQCAVRLNGLRRLRPVACPTTAQAALGVAQMKDPHKVALASAHAANIYDLEILDANWQDDHRNTTRFLILSRTAEIVPEANKFSLYFHLPHTCGALAEILATITGHGHNISYIGSRPIPGQPWHYGFHLDLDGNLEDLSTLWMIRDLRKKTKDLRILGNYPRDAS